MQSLLGNEQLKKNLTRSLEAGKISHFYLISGPEGSGKHTLARWLSAAILCQSSGKKPCCSCHPCRKVLANAHPDFITVDDPEKKTVPVDLIRQARADMYVQPNESDHKIYLFPRAQDMGLPGQNALLKVLEEPPAYGVFLLLTDNPNKLLPTVRSRCTELKMQPLSSDILLPQLAKDFPQAAREDLAAAAERSGGFLGQARLLLEESQESSPQAVGFVNALCTGDPMALLETLVPMERWKRDELADMLESWLQIGENALLLRCGGQTASPLARQLASGQTTPELRDVLRELRMAALYTRSNVSPGAVCGYLEWALQRKKPENRN